MQIPFKKILLLITIGFLIFPVSALAGTYKADGETICFEGLVPCGKTVYIGEETNGSCTGAETVNIPCQFCHLFVMINEILNFIWFRIAPPIIVLLAVIASFLFIFSGGDPKRVQKSRRIATSLAIGILLIYGSWALVNIFFTTIGVQDWTGLGEGGWSEIECEIEIDPGPEDEGDEGDGGETDEINSCEDIEGKEECENSEMNCYWQEHPTGKCRESSTENGGLTPACSDCGEGVTNVCDEEECKDISPDCEFEENSWPLPGGKCSFPEGN